MWTTNFDEELKKVVLTSDVKGTFCLDYVQGEEGIYLSKGHLKESGMNLLDLADISYALENYNLFKQPRIFITEEF